MCVYALHYLLTTILFQTSEKMWDSSASESNDYIHNGEQINRLVAGIKVVTQTGSTSDWLKLIRNCLDWK